MTKPQTTADPGTATRFAEGAVVGFTTGTAYYSFIVRINDAHQRCPVIGWATVIDGYDDNGDARTHVEAALLADRQVLTETQFRAIHGPDSLVELHG